jgi:hypothetical protein
MSVAETLTRMCGVWHDRVQVYDLAGRVLDADVWSGTPGQAPFENLVYIDFNGHAYRQTNVTIAGRPLHVRTFTGRLDDGVLVFDRLGPDDPEHIGLSGGPGVLVFAARRVTEAWCRYAEPDFIRLLGDDARTRTTLLYRGGAAIRTLTADGRRVAARGDRRVPIDPRGAVGPVHEPRRDTPVFRGDAS